MAWFDVSRRALCGVALLALSACSHARPELASQLVIPATLIKAGDHESVGEKPRTPVVSYFRKPLANDLVCLQEPFRNAPPPATKDAFILSGGNQNGAFGAGFFLGLKEKGNLPPEPQFVTGVSTGALQASFLFLGDQHHDPAGGIMPTDRTYLWAGGVAATPSPDMHPDRPALQRRQSNYEDLALAYSASREGDILHKRLGGEYGVVVWGTNGTLEPLRARLFDLISPQTVKDVAYEGCRGRALFVGVVDVDNGQAYALDLTRLAQMAYDPSLTTKAEQDKRMGQVRQAYVAALLASSSVPMGAMPEALNISPVGKKTHMFIDGGARFGVLFADDKADLLVEKGKEGAVVTIVVNTLLDIEPWDKSEKKWSIIDLGMRSLSILENQVYRFSVDAVEDWADRNGGVRLAYRSNEHIKPTGKQDGTEAPEAHLFLGKTCQKWYDEDQTKLKPLQFHPNFMACLTDYGRERGQLPKWNIVPGKKP